MKYKCQYIKYGLTGLFVVIVSIFFSNIVHASLVAEQPSVLHDNIYTNYHSFIFLWNYQAPYSYYGVSGNSEYWITVNIKNDGTGSNYVATLSDGTNECTASGNRSDIVNSSFANVTIHLTGCSALATIDPTVSAFSFKILIDGSTSGNIRVTYSSNTIPTIGEIPYFLLYTNDPSDTNTSTHFITLYPADNSTVATTTKVGAKLLANQIDFPNYGRLKVYMVQDSAFACVNSGAVYDALVTCSGENAPAQPISLDFGTSTLKRILAGDYDIFQDVTFGGGGKWTAWYEIQQVSMPWYYLGLFNSYNTIVSTTTHFTIGQLSPMDVAREAVQSHMDEVASTTRHGIGSIIASTTSRWKDACNIFSGFSFTSNSTFNFGDCLTLTIYPGDVALSENFDIIKQTPPWGYVFRVIDILNEPIASTSLPSISYEFSTTSPMHDFGTISFDPFKSIEDSGTLINEMKSDRGDSYTVWTILMPIVNTFIYLVLGFKIIHDLTGIHSKDKRNDVKNN